MSTTTARGAIKGTAGDLIELPTAAGTRLLYTGDALTLAAAKAFVGRRIELPTGMSHERAEYTVEGVSQNRETGDVMAWLTRPGVVGGGHYRIVGKS